MDPSLSIRLQGGLGNQLFQWAAAEVVAESTGRRVELDARFVERSGARGYQLAWLEGRFGELVSIRHETNNRIWAVLDKVLPVPIYLRVVATGKAVRPEATVGQLLSDLRSGHVATSSYLQDPEFLMRHREGLANKIRASLCPPKGEQQYLAVHVRRGDYVSHPAIAERFGALSLSYFEAAVRDASGNLNIVVSDDPEWCRANLIPRLASRGVDAEVWVGASQLEDLAMMVFANELIVSNSTFSWWAAFAGVAGRVHAPLPWLASGEGAELVLSGWVARDRDSGRAL